MGRKGSATTHIAAAPEKIYALVTDVARMGEWSPETVKAEWVDGATGPAVGARFKGTNKLGFLRWSTKPTVEVADAGRTFTFSTGNPKSPSTRWTYAFVASGDGTDVTESWEELKQIPLIGGLMMNDKREKQLNEGYATTLERIKAAAESS